MFKILSIFLIAVLCFACETQNPNDQIQYLDGYWEINKVTLANGSEKTFNINTTIDYIQVLENKGIRKKVNPKLDGSFTTTKDVETFTFKIEDDSLRLYYKTPFDTWKETVIKAKDSSLVILNRDGNTYFYKKFEKFNFN